MGKINVGVISLGCSKNQVDLERMLAILQEKKFNISVDVNCCDVIIINTCAFIESARQESIDEIRWCVDFKKNNSRLRLIVVTGCLAERYQKNLRKQLPEIDIIVGIGGNKDIDKIILDAFDRQDKKVYQKDVFLPKSEMMICGKRVLTTPDYFAYLKIADGCNNRCTYCAIPQIRGNYWSVPKEILVEEARDLVDRGVKELNIIAQDITNYGVDVYGKLALPELLRELCEIEKLEWIRLLYCYPDKITDELIDVIKTEDKIVKYIDIPFQHVNDKVLKNMNRKGNKALILDVLSKLRKAIPDIVIRSTFIVGFPGETDEEFAELLDFVKQQKLNKVGCFRYSREHQTRAFEFDFQVSENLKTSRYNLLMDAQDQVVEELGLELAGKTLKVLVEGFDEKKGLYFGRSYMEAPDIDGFVEFSLGDCCLEKSIVPGDFVDVSF